MMTGAAFTLALLIHATAPPPSPVAVTKVTAPEKALRFEVVVAAPLDEVWAALTTTAGLETWLWRDARVDLRAGGDWLVLYPEGKTGGGTIVSFDPPHRIELRALAPEWFPTVRRERTTAVFELDSVTPASTRVTLVQTGWKSGKEWDDAYEYLAQGNAQLLTQLHQRFAEGPVDWTKSHD